MRRWGLAAVLAFTACDPLGGYKVEDRPSVLAAELPMLCFDSVGKTSSGVWGCQVGEPNSSSSTVAISRGEGDQQVIAGDRIAIAGASIWTWNRSEGHLAHFEKDQLTPSVVRDPDVEFDWNAGHAIGQPLSSFVVRERMIVIATDLLRVIAALPSRLEVRSETATSFTINSHFGNTAWALLDSGDHLWGWGPFSHGLTEGTCGYPFDMANGISGEEQCSTTPSGFVGIANGGMWLRDPGDGTRPAAARFHRPESGTLTKVEALELPNLKWVTGGVPWVLHPDASTMLVPRVEGDRLIIDRYKASPGYTWAGANDMWVYEVGATTRVYAR